MSIVHFYDGFIQYRSEDSLLKKSLLKKPGNSAIVPYPFAAPFTPSP